MFTIAEVIRLLTRIFAKANKRFPKGLEGVDIRLKAKKIHDVGKANNYQGAISEDQLKQFLAWEKQAPITKEVSKDILKVPKKKGEVIKVDFDPGGKQTFKGMSEGVEDVSFKPGMDPKGKIIAESPSQIIVRMKKMTPIDAMKEANSVIGRKGKYKNLTKEQSKKILKDTEDHIFERDIKPDPEDLAHGGRTGSGLNYLLGEDDQNSRVPYGSGGAGQPPVTFTLTGGGGADEGKYNYGGSFGVGGNFPLMGGEVGITGNLPFGRSSDKFGVGESTLGDQWGVNVQGKWPVNFNKMLMGKADGGRIGFGLGGIDKARRLFLKWAGAGAATAGVAKSGLFGLLKSGKPSVIKELTSVPIKAGVDGMPVWFKPLVNKVIKEGKEIGSTVERQIVHEAQLPGSKTPIHVTQDLNTGNVAVDIGVTKHGFPDGHLGQPVSLEYRASEVIEGPIKKGKPTKTKEEFNVEEAEFTGGHPENIKFEESTLEKFGQHGSNFDEVEKFATGTVKKKTAKESLKAERSHWVPEGDDMASGGRVPLGAGDWVKKRFHEYTKEGRDEFKKEWLDRKDLGMTVEEWNALPLKEKIKIRLREGNASGGLAGILGE